MMVDCEGVSLGSSCAKLPHSHSAEISKTPPPGGPKSAGKMLALRVVMLDDNVTLFQVQAKALGRVLFEQVCKQLNLLEADYFGLEYQDHSGTRYWLDLEKQLSRQVGLTQFEPLLNFCVKFYTPDPAQLEEEYTRYLFCLQIKRDLAQGHIQCNDNTAALMASYIVQAECGDYNADDYPDAGYLSSYKFVQHQDRELEKKIMENHKKHIGQPPAEADLNLLETARRCELYGMKMHPVKDHEGVPLNLAVAHMGIVVFQSYTKIYTFSWAKVRKISFKRKKFLIKLHPDGYGYYKDTVEFFFESRNECKNLWKKCVENHGFFRCNAVKRVPRQRTRVLSRGSSFRYSGKTQKQMVEFVRENYVKRQNFQRSQSFRQSSSVHSSVATNVGGSISAHPLIPLGDNSIVSASCGSMVLVGEDSPSLTYRADQTIHIHSNHSRHLPQPPHQDQQAVQGSTTTAITTFIPSTSTGLRSYNTTSSQTDIVDLVESSSTQTPHLSNNQYLWQRSASAKELRKPIQQSSEDSYVEPIPHSSRNFAIAGSKTPSFDRDAEAKVYSSSYPGTTSSLSTESADELEPGGSVLVIDTGSSRDDISHDSYELLERDSRNYSRSCSLGSSGPENQDDELFIMDDYRDIDDVDKRLGYVEPRYRNVNFNEFNELCKRGFASKRSSQAVEFNEFEAKCVPGAVVGHDRPPEERYPVERTKSEPFVSDFWKVAREHRKLFHQKSFDYTPSESIDSDASKSTADIPYTLHKRQQMNGTSCFECRSPVSPNKSEEKPIIFERKPSFKGFSKTKHDSELNSQDSGLSLSLGAESTDDLEETKNDKKYANENKLSVKKDLLKVNSEDGPRHKSLLSKMKAVSADSGLKRVFSFERPPPVEVIKIPSQDGEGIVICSSDTKNFSLDTTDPDVIIVEYHTKRKRAFQKRSSSEKKGSSLDIVKEDKSKKSKEWKSESSSSCDFQDTDFKRERFSKEVKTSIEGKVVRESLEEKELKKQKSEELYRQKTEELRKQKSEEFQRQKSEEFQRQKSEEMQKKILRRQEVIEQLRQKHEDLNKIEIVKATKEEKKPPRIPQKMVKQEHVFKELSPKPIHKHDKIILEVPVEINATEQQLGYCTCEHKSSTEIDKMEDINEEKDSVFEDDYNKEDISLIKDVEKENVFSEEEPEIQEPKDIEIPKSPIKPVELPIEKAPEIEEHVRHISPEVVWKKFGELPPIANKRERSPVLFARLGFSEGSTFSPTKAQSPSSSRRAKSLDAPVVSLHRLPPITSFSSKDDTVDNEEGIELEEKTIRNIINVIEEEDSSNLSPLIQDSNRFMATLPDLSQILPEIVPVLEENIFETLEPDELLSYNIEPPPYTQIFEGEQELPDIARLCPDKTPPVSQFSDEQKVPEFSNSDEPSEIDVDDKILEDLDSEEVFDGPDEPQPERRPSTRQERLDSFKNTKSYSVDIWTSEETEQPNIPTVDVEDVDWREDDDAFAPDPVEAMMEQLSPKQKEFPVDPNEFPVNPNEIPIDLIPELPCIDTNPEIEDPDIIPLTSLCEKIAEPLDLKIIPAKRSFDEDLSSSSSFKPDKTTLKPFSLESSGSSSLEEGIFPPDDNSHFADEEEGSSNSAKDEYQGFGYSVAGAELVIGGYTGGVFGLSRTLSRISERSTTSEQERSDFDDDLSTKPSSRSLSLEDESLMSSDRQPSLSSDPSINPEVEEQPLPPLPPEPLGFKIPPPLIQHDDEWPSPPNSSFDTPIVSNVETYYMDIRPEEPTKVILPKEPYDDYSSDSEYENKTLQDDDGHDSSTKESTVKLALKHKKPGNSSDTSLGISDFSSSTSTVKHQYYAVKSDDSSLADFGSLSTEMLTSSRKNSDDSMCLRRRSYQIQRRSFDEYDSPYSESDESCPKQLKRYANLPSPTTPGKKITKSPSKQSERRNVCSKSIARAKCYSYYSLARSPPSDGSSSSLEMGEPPSTPNTIPRVSKRRRHVPPSKRRHRIVEPDPRDVVLEKSSSPELEDVPRNNNNTIQEQVYASTPKMNGGAPNGHYSELASPELSPVKTNDKSREGLDTLDGEMKKKRYSLDKVHFIGKEILMTERTYRKDLEVINLWLRDEFSKHEENNSISHLLNIIDPLHDAHCHLLKEIELNLAQSERGTSHRKVADIILKTVEYLPLYEEYIHEHQKVLIELCQDLNKEEFEKIYTDFEKNKMCYLPLTLFILKPIQRLLHYSNLIDRIVKFFGPDHADYTECDIARKKYLELSGEANRVLQESENFVQLVELGRDVTGFEGVLTEGERKFIRHGRLGKFSARRGTQQRMFVLLSDMLVYSKRYGQIFKVHGQMSLKALRIEDRVDNPTPNSFIIYSGDRPLTVSAESLEEKDKWLEDLSHAIEIAKNDENCTTIFTLKCSNSTDDINEKQEDEKSGVTPQRSNTTIHVCWHRYTSISLNDLVRAAQNQLSGYLLRKFKNSNGWQKLWVVFTNFCLFFYKTFQDDAPLASLPLLGYCVTIPSEKDQIQKDFVFKLQFKNHVYFFRAESEYTFGRWMEVIGSATQHSGRIRLFSRKESALDNITYNQRL